MNTPHNLKIAYEIVGTEQTDKYGTPLFSKSDIEWAKGVIKFFQNLFNKARAMTGAWCLRIKLAWVELKRKLWDKYFTPQIKCTKTDKYYKVLFKSGVYIPDL